MYELQVEGMTCGGCVASVKRSIQGIDGQANVEVDLAAKTVKVETSSSLEKVVAAIDDAGYDVVSAH